MRLSSTFPLGLWLSALVAIVAIVAAGILINRGTPSQVASPVVARLAAAVIVTALVAVAKLRWGPRAAAVTGVAGTLVAVILLVPIW